MIMWMEVPVNVQYPMWCLVLVLLLNAFKGYLPAITELSGAKKCEEKCKLLQAEIDELRRNYNEVNRKYLILIGSLSVMRSRLKELGYDNIPDFENITDK